MNNDLFASDLSRLEMRPGLVFDNGSIKAKAFIGAIYSKFSNYTFVDLAVDSEDVIFDKIKNLTAADFVVFANADQVPMELHDLVGLLIKHNEHTFPRTNLKLTELHYIIIFHGNDMRDIPDSMSPAALGVDIYNEKKLKCDDQEAMLNYAIRYDLQTLFGKNVRDITTFKGVEWVVLKSLASKINNIFPFHCAHAFVKQLRDKDFINEVTLAALDEYISEQSPSANGYDIRWDASKGAPKDALKFVAEMKATIPWGKNRFGAQQQKSIEKDFKNLFKCKKSEKKISRTFKEYLKFFVMIETPNGGQREAMKHLCDNIMNSPDGVKFEDLKDVPAGGPLSPDIIYIVYIDIKDAMF